MLSDMAKNSNEVEGTGGPHDRVARAFRAAMAGPPFDDQAARDMSEMSDLERAELALLIQEAGGLPASVDDACGNEKEAAFLLSVREQVDKLGKADIYRRAMRRAADDKDFALVVHGLQMSGYENNKSPTLVAMLMLDGMNRYLLRREVGIGFLVSVANSFYEAEKDAAPKP
jgi:hypothetical protein